MPDRSFYALLFLGTQDLHFPCHLLGLGFLPFSVRDLAHDGGEAALCFIQENKSGGKSVLSN